MPTATHDVIALVSGGKDSFLALVHCLAQNHHVVALANLHPPIQSPPASSSRPADSTTNSTIDTAPDANSYMYQTVGHTLIPLYARALSIPLYRGEIVGAAVNSQRDYYPSSSTSPPPTSDPMQPQQEQAEPVDETESLIPLLRRILRAHPSATALVSGAILSTYQRTRIESVALRLGLVPLAPLWQYPFLPTPVPRPAGLLEDVAAVGLEARIVKVASGGLDEGFLWGDLRNIVMRRRVESGVGMFGGSVLGEGGEFETLVVDGPEGLFKGRIEIEEAKRVVRRGEGGEAYLAFTGGRVVEKKKPVVGENNGGEEGWRRKLRVPDLWDEQFKALVGRIKEAVPRPRTCSLTSDVDAPNVENHPIRTAQAPRPSPLVNIPQPHTTHTRSTFTISNLTSFSSLPPLSPTPPSFSSSSSSSMAIQQTHAIMSHLRTILASAHPPRSPSHILFTTLLLRHMAHFPLVNVAYAALFVDGEAPAPPIPPARVTVACGERLPSGVEVVLRVVVARGATAAGASPEGAGEVHRDGLHVQSRSYWAPANIGPYSQAVSVAAPRRLRGREEGDEGAPAVVYVAGQIPLVPARMQILPAAGDGSGAGVTGAAIFGARACLALQHLWRVGAAMRVQWWMGAVAFLASSPAPTTEGELEMERRARVACTVWTTIHDPAFWPSAAHDGLPDDFDVWDLKHGRAAAVATAEKVALPDFALVRDGEGSKDDKKATRPGFFAVQVPELPAACPVEWQALGVRDVHRVHVAASSCTLPAGSVRTCTAHPFAGAVSYISIPLHTAGASGSLADQIWAVVREVRGWDDAGPAQPSLDMTVYTAPRWDWGVGDGEGEVATAMAKAHVIPCEAVWGPEGTRLAGGIVLQIDF